MNNREQASLETQLLGQLDSSLRDLDRPLFVALSGGVDSMLLLEAIWRLNKPATVIHVHHGLQDSADAWLDFCAHQARRRGMAFVGERVTVDASAGIEAGARAARYRALARHVGAGCLLLAQHRDDQAETLLERLMRGAGADGLAAMATRRHQGKMLLLRPLLSLARADIEALARYWQLDWIEDPSNQDRRFTRNWLRHELLPLWEAQQPSIKRQLAASAEHMRQSARLQDDLAAIDLRQLTAKECGLPVAGLQALPAYRRHNLLRYWLARRETFRPGNKILEHIDYDILAAAADRQPQLALSRGLLRRYRGRLYWLPKAVATPPQAASWPLDRCLQLAALTLRARRRARTAVTAPPAGEGLGGELTVGSSVSRLGVAFAVGGERLLLNGRHQQVSECWRAAGVAPWLRQWLPLFYVDAELVAVAAIGVADNWRAATNDGWQLSWRLPADFAGG